ncbi:Serine/threonine-protein kinaseA [Sesamum angolense]|uniref:Serine/threonine-protein kinaseA n=1 Tax=Sesamum angolense TaxID=2727404 RepID=A0AAE1VZ68_9LAMI|nr:Serine/threonine-protein kinaseA [Sesamum angolense]
MSPTSLGHRRRPDPNRDGWWEAGEETSLCCIVLRIGEVLSLMVFQFIGTPVIQESRYDGKVLFMISIEPAPMLEDKEKWSLVFHDFVAKCLTKDPRLRPTAAEMLKKWSVNNGSKIEKAKQIRASMASQTQDIAPDATLPREGPLGGPISNEGIVGTVPSRPQDGVLPVVTQDNQAPPDGVQTAIGGDFGTVIVHEKVEISGTATPTSTRAEESFSATTRLGSLHAILYKIILPFSLLLSDIEINGCISIDPYMLTSLWCLSGGLDSPASARTVAAGLQSPHSNLHGISIPQGPSLTDASATSDTVSRKALDKVALIFQVRFLSWSIYSAGNTVPIPFLRATDISPIALLSDNVLGGWQQDNGGNIAVAAMQELFSGDAQPKKGRSRQNEVLFGFLVLRNLFGSDLYHDDVCYLHLGVMKRCASGNASSAGATNHSKPFRHPSNYSAVVVI